MRKKGDGDEEITIRMRTWREIKVKERTKEKVEAAGQ